MSMIDWSGSVQAPVIMSVVSCCKEESMGLVGFRAQRRGRVTALFSLFCYLALKYTVKSLETG